MDVPALLQMADRPSIPVRKIVARAGLVFALCCGGVLAEAAPPLQFTGALLGTVKDSAGVPQMGATVTLFNRYDKLVQKAVTNLRGDFVFESLAPDVYSLRVTMTSFVPALKRHITIQPGMQSVLAINLASMLSSIELVYSAPHQGTLMTDEWKWVLRSSMSTRPVLRALPDILANRQGPSEIFSDTNGMLRVSSGQSSPLPSYGSEPDLGTAFALATSLFGNNRLQFSGNFGYEIDGALPTTAFRTTFSRNEPGVPGPEVKLTVQQASLPARGAGFLIGGQQQNSPALRTLSLTMVDRAPIMDGVELEYGASLESVTFFDRLNFISPFARLTYDLGLVGKFAVGYSSGAPPIELFIDPRDPDASFQQDLAALSVLPRVSLRGGRAHVQRTENLEIGYEVVAGSRKLALGGYREVVRNGAVTITGASDVIDGFDLLPELSSRSSVFNIGGYRRYGYSAAFTQTVADDYSFTLAYGSGGVLRADDRTLRSDSPSELRSLIHQKRQQRWLSARVTGTAPYAGTKLTASYQWTDYRSLVPVHIYFTQRSIVETGLNVRVRQPIPSPRGVPGRLEATAELRNLLAQGYLPITTVSGRRMLIAHSPRTVRGGLSLIF